MQFSVDDVSYGDQVKVSPGQIGIVTAIDSIEKRLYVGFDDGHADWFDWGRCDLHQKAMYTKAYGFMRGDWVLTSDGKGIIFSINFAPELQGQLPYGVVFEDSNIEYYDGDALQLLARPVYNPPKG